MPDLADTHTGLDFAALGMQADLQGAVRACRLPATVPTRTELAWCLWEKIQHDHLLPALQATTPQAYQEVFNREVGRFSVRMMAMAELAPAGASNQQEAMEAIARDAAEFGGALWEDAVRDATADVNRACRVAQRLAEMPFRPEDAQSVRTSLAALTAFAWAVFGLRVMIQQPNLASELVQEWTRELLRSGARIAYVTLRAVELQRREGGTPDELPLYNQSEDERSLEEEAEKSSREAISRAEGP